MIRITGGEFKGRRLRVPDGIRPTAELVRKALFDILGDRVVGARFLDAAAGSGAVGLEAVSRGAEAAVFLEKNRRVRDVLNANVESLGLSDVCTVVSSDVGQGGVLLPAASHFDIVFLDLPYEMEAAAAINGLIPHVRPGSGVLVVERGDGDELEAPGLARTSCRRYGATFLTFFSA